jgi:hypothetical protein
VNLAFGGNSVLWYPLILAIRQPSVNYPEGFFVKTHPGVAPCLAFASDLLKSSP